MIEPIWPLKALCFGASVAVILILFWYAMTRPKDPPS